jgi:hypothetical protein
MEGARRAAGRALPPGHRGFGALTAVAEAPEVRDTFTSDAPCGAVLGTRLGIDSERALSIDHGALRVGPLLEPGWGKAGIAYGPFERTGGVALAVFMLNGHNTAQVENLPDPLPQRLYQWLRGSGAYSLPARLGQWLHSGQLARTWLQFRWWMRLRKGRRSLRGLDENLAVGWFPVPVPKDPPGTGSAFVMHATGPDNGELWANAASRALPVLRNVHNLPMYFVVVLRERGAAYYAASAPQSAGLPAPPWLRPLAIDAHGTDRSVYASITQSTIGQIGFRVDSRVYGVRIARVPDLAQWCGTAFAADTLLGEGALEAQPAERGGVWTILSGPLQRTAEGLAAQASQAGAELRGTTECGLLHALVRLGPSGDGVAVTWRGEEDGCLAFEIDAAGCSLVRWKAGNRELLARGKSETLASGEVLAVQVNDYDGAVECSVGGVHEISAQVAQASGRSAHGVGVRFAAAGGQARVSHLEAHAGRVRMPQELDLGTIDFPPPSCVRMRETFEGSARSLEGKALTEGGRTWRRLIGRGAIRVLGDGSARVAASAAEPNPGRTAFGFDWDEPDFVELEMRLTPPGTQQKQRERSRSGFIVWQDPDNYVIVNVWNSDVYGGASVSSFFHLQGFENIYDAVWTNVGRRVWFGREVLLRLAFDGEQFLVSLDGEPVLYRRLTDVRPGCARLRVKQVGIAANWEWGDDTGSRFRNFIARGSDS